MATLLYASTKQKDMRYIAGMDILDPFFYVDTGKSKYVYLDSREYGVFQERNENASVQAVLLAPPFLSSNELALRIIKEHGLYNSPIEVPFAFPISLADFLRSKGVILVPVSVIFPERIQKKSYEMEALRSSIKSTEKAFSLIENILKESKVRGADVLYHGVVLTSELLKKEVERLLVEEGMVNEEGIIISTGIQTAIPHHMGFGAIRANEPIVCDIFPKNKNTGYFADLTRTFVKGNPFTQIAFMMDAILEAQSLAMKGVRPGVLAADIHMICSESLKSSGFDVGEKGFTHSTGHGVGLDVHELPFLGVSSRDVLCEGNVVTIEPGLYYSGRGGVRVEDMGVVIKDGFEVLSTYSKNWLIP